MNTQRVVGSIGILRILTLILGFIVLILTGLYHYHDLKEQFFFSIVSIMLSLSILLLILLLFDILQPAVANSVDMSFHLIGGIVLLLATGLMFYSVFSIGNRCTFYYRGHIPCPYQPYVPRVALTILAALNGITYVFCGTVIKRTEYF